MDTKFFNQQPLRSCQSTLDFYFFLLLSRLESSSTPVWKIRFRRLRVRVSLATTVTLSALLRATSNYRTYGALLLIAGAQLSEVAYVLFDQSVGQPLAYWNAYYYLQAIGPHLSALLTVTGFYLLIPQFSKLKFFALIPVAYKLGKIIWLACIDNNVDFHRFVPIGFLLYGFTAALIWLFVFEWLMSLHYHKREGSIARMVGVLVAPNIDDKTRLSAATNEAKIYQTLK